MIRAPFAKVRSKHCLLLALSECQQTSFIFLQVSHKAGNKSFTFFLSSEYERSQWVETLQHLQSALPPLHKIPGQANPAAAMSMDELQSWITR